MNKIIKRMDETYVITHNGLPYHVVPGDNLYAATAMAIENGAEWEWETPPVGPTDEEAAEGVRAEVKRLLAASDWTQLPDAPLSPDQVTEWQLYRQALRDVSKQEGFPFAVTLPEVPE